MPVNRDKIDRWKEDVFASVDLYNNWFLMAAPKAFRDSRAAATTRVEESIRLSDDLGTITPELLKSHPEVLQPLRMAACPPIARDRLIGLAHAGKNLVKVMEEEKKLPPRMAVADLDRHLIRIAEILIRMLDRDIFPWIESKAEPSEGERFRASTIVADRLCGAVSDLIIRNAREQRQFALIAEYLNAKGYRKEQSPGKRWTEMDPGTFSFRKIVVVGNAETVNIPIDVVIQPIHFRSSGLPLLIEAKSAGDFMNTNKRRKEEAKKVRQLRETYGDEVEFILFLCGYFDASYPGYSASDGIDWIWEHRIEDMDQLGI